VEVDLEQQILRQQLPDQVLQFQLQSPQLFLQLGAGGLEQTHLVEPVELGVMADLVVVLVEMVDLEAHLEEVEQQGRVITEDQLQVLQEAQQVVVEGQVLLAQMGLHLQAERAELACNLALLGLLFITLEAVVALLVLELKEQADLEEAELPQLEPMELMERQILAAAAAVVQMCLPIQVEMADLEL
jgi:hypothetical protein